MSSAYWPWIWPQPESAAGFTPDPEGSALELPVRDRELTADIRFGEPEEAEPLGVHHPATLDEPRHGGTRVYPDGLEFTEDALETYTIDEADPLSARTRSDRSIRPHRPEPGWDTTVRTRSEITCDETDFLTSNEVICTEGGEVIFHRTREKRIPRTAS